MSRQAAGSPKAKRTRHRGDAISLAVPPDVRLRVSPAGFWRLCCEPANRDLRLERTAEGVLIVMMPTGSFSGLRNMSLGAQLWNWNRATGLGFVFDSNAGFTLPNSAIRAPDASWISRERWEAVPQAQKVKFSPICPDFAVELQSPSDKHSEVQEKMREYLAQGARLGWLIDPGTGEVEIYRAGRAVEVLKRPETLSGEDVLPGFVLDLKGILFE